MRATIRTDGDLFLSFFVRCPPRNIWYSVSSKSKPIAWLALEIEPVLKRFLTGMPQRFEVAKNRVLLHGAVIEIDDASSKAVKIQRVSESIV